MTITERCADPEFQKFIARAHQDWWKDGFEKQIPPTDLTFAIIREICAGKASEHHPEYLALVNAFDRERVKVADMDGGEK